MESPDWWCSCGVALSHAIAYCRVSYTFELVCVDLVSRLPSVQQSHAQAPPTSTLELHPLQIKLGTSITEVITSASFAYVVEKI